MRFAWSLKITPGRSRYDYTTLYAEVRDFTITSYGVAPPLVHEHGTGKDSRHNEAPTGQPIDGTASSWALPASWPRKGSARVCRLASLLMVRTGEHLRSDSRLAGFFRARSSGPCYLHTVLSVAFGRNLLR